MSIILNVSFAIVTVIVSTFLFFKWKFKYWERKNVPYIKATFPFGTMNNPFNSTVCMGVLLRNQYEEAKKRGQKYVGIYVTCVPNLLAVDLDLIKNVLTKDFAHFQDRGIYVNERDDPLSAHLFSLEGTRWKNLRAKLTPTFTSSKMKTMFNILLECGKQLEEAIDIAFDDNQAINIKEFLSCFGTDVIGSCAFGIECNSFKNSHTAFWKYSKLIFLPPAIKFFQSLVGFANPSLARFLRFTTTTKEVSDFFITLIKRTVESREKSGERRNDFLQILIDLKNDDDGLTMEELAAQCFIFFIAGFETSSTTMTFCLFELSQNPEIQEKLREEIKSVLDANNGVITYDVIKSIKYLNQVIEETLRKYPPLPMLNRKCVANYVIPNTNVTIEKGMGVVIPLYGTQNDPEYFPNPEKFDPDRFSEENKKKIVPFSYAPFGEGPRLCVGLRFGMMQTRLGLLLLLRKCKFSLSDKTQLPLRMDPRGIIMSAVGDIWLNVEKI